MIKIFTIVQKELCAYFKSPIACIVLVVTVSVFNIFFYMIIDQNREATLRDVFQVMEFMFVFLVPLFTMRVFAEEKSTGTMEFLMTTPTSNTAIVVGKYLGSFLFFSLIVSTTLVYYLVIEYFGHPDRAATATGILGLWLEGGLFVAVGVLASSWTRSQVIAAISSYAILFSLYFSITFSKYVSAPAQEFLQYFSTMTHAANFSVGVVAPGDVVYYLSGIFCCLFLARISVENRLWR
ncbi:MAG: ABC transporter permease subunit [Candidatus Omnitrophica bacterium]|nr:ABC transporter permease subunit [Candidatus Omnitrophota bacterium]